MVLYINGNYPHHSLHGELVFKLAELGNDITVFVPMMGRELDGKYNCTHPRVRIIYCDCLQKLDRVFFITKIHRIANEIEKQVDMGSVDCILAGTVYSDGAVAYLLHKKHNIPFSVACRGTDVTFQMRWRPYLNGFIKQLLGKVTNIVFVSPSYEQYLERLGDYKDKYVIIPNAVNDYWFHNFPQKQSVHKPVSLIYVGEVVRNKNISTVLSIVAELNKRGIRTEFHIVGSGDEEEKCRALSKQLGIEKQVFFHGWQSGKEKIKAFYDQADIFIMLSYRETFGTVYIEALSQGLPVLYTKGQGIDGYFEEGSVGYGCDPTDAADAANKVVKILNSYPVMSKQCIIESKRFRWEIVANQYNDVINAMRKQ